MLYVVEMQRWGDNETHHYIIGAFSSESAAIEAGDIEKVWRDGKYEPHIQQLVVDKEMDKEKIDYYNDCSA